MLVQYIQLFQVVLSIHLHAECTKWHRDAVYRAHSVFARITLLHIPSGCWLECDCLNHCLSLMSWRQWRIPQYSNWAHPCFQITASSVMTNISKETTTKKTWQGARSKKPLKFSSDSTAPSPTGALDLAGKLAGPCQGCYNTNNC